MRVKQIFRNCLCFMIVTTGCTTTIPMYEAKDVILIARERITIGSPNREYEAVIDKHYAIQIEQGDLSLLTYEHSKKPFNDSEQIFPNIYTEVEGVLTFRGNHMRTDPAFGVIPLGSNYELKSLWTFKTKASPRWGGGAGWTGQPGLIKWSPEVKQIMNIKEPYKQQPEFVEVIYASLDGYIYFLDLLTGEETRDPIGIGNPIKGSVSIDSRGYPLLYVGDGIPQNASFGQRIFSLIDQKELFFLKGNNAFAYRNWGAFDSSPLINRMTDTLISAGENGLIYKIKLNTNFNLEKGTISINPELMKYRYRIKGNLHQGIENSIAVYRNLAFFGDNGGSIQGIDLQTMTPYFALGPLDDTDATIAIETKGEDVFFYTGTEVDIIRKDGDAHIRKINGKTGEVIWHKTYPAFFYDGINGGVLASPVVGKNDLEDVVIFTVARYKQRYSGLMVALNKETGEEMWQWEMPHYAWSSPVAVYNEMGEGYLIQCDSAGNVTLVEGRTGRNLHQINLGANIEASPAVFNNIVVVGTRGGKFFAIEIQEKTEVAN